MFTKSSSFIHQQPAAAVVLTSISFYTENSIVSRSFTGLVTADLDVLFEAVRLLLKGIDEANMSLAMVETTKSQLVLKLSCGNERLASSDFTLRQ
jgi:hypothetical protein